MRNKIFGGIGILWGGAHRTALAHFRYFSGWQFCLSIWPIWSRTVWSNHARSRTLLFLQKIQLRHLVCESVNTDHIAFVPI
jgi:hypothetical protein